jgi:ElaB/YqjD/DUF883 family membrane-anchored ribosome-binding protein
MKDQISDKAVQTKDAVADFGRKMVENIDAQRAPAAASLDQTASALHQQADRVAGVAHATADKLHATADYVRTQDVKSMANDVVDLVRRYPGPALAAAAAVGFLVARVVRPRN